MQSSREKICFKIRCEMFFCIQMRLAWFQLSMPRWLFSIFDPDRASQRKAWRNRQSWFLRSWSLRCLSTNQVISGRYLFLHNVSLYDNVPSYKLLNAAINRRNEWFSVCVHQAESVVEPAGTGSVSLRDQRWMALLWRPLVGTSPVWACCRPCWVRWRPT